MMDLGSTPELKTNIGTKERIFSVATGSALLYYSLAKKRSPLLAAAASYLILRGSTGYSPVYQSVDVSTVEPPKPLQVKSVISINLPREKVYAFWRNFENLGRSIEHLEEVKVLDEQHSEWKTAVPWGDLQWVSQITVDIKNERISWESVDDSEVEQQGEVWFRDAGKFGTEVQLDISYKAPAGKIGLGVAKLLNPVLKEVIKEDMRNIRRFLETGEVPSIKGQPSGRNKKN